MTSYSFLGFTLDADRYELSRGGKALALPRVPMEILFLLVRAEGRMVTRQTIAEAIWPGVDPGDVIQNTNAAINRIRSVLRDDPAKPRFIQTVIGKGYRFIAPVTPLEVPTAAAAAVPADAESRPAGQDAPSALVPVGEAGAVAALAEAPGGRHLLVKALALAALCVFLLGALLAWRWKTAHPGPDCKEQECLARTALTTNESQNSLSAGALAPNGRMFAYSDADGVKLRILEGGLTRSVAAPATSEVDELHWFPDGLHLLLSGLDRTGASPQLWLLSITGEAPLLLRQDGQHGVPSPDGTRIAFTSAKNTELWLADAHGESPRLLLRAVAGTTYPALLWSGDGKHMLLSRSDFVQSAQTYPGRAFGLRLRSSYIAVDASTGAVTASTPEVRFRSAVLQTGNRLLFARTEPDEDSFSSLLYEVDLDPMSGALLGRPSLRGTYRDHKILGLSTSEDRKQVIALIRYGQTDIHVADVVFPGPRLEAVRQLTADNIASYPHAWTPDSKAVIFEAMRTGSYNLYRQSLDRHDAEAIEPSSSDQVLAQYTPDGRWILFEGRAGGPDKRTIYRIDPQGGVPTAVYPEMPGDEFKCPLTGHDCVLREAQNRERFVYFALDPMTGKGAELCSMPWMPATLGEWSLSPDAGTIAVPSLDPANPFLRLVTLPAKGKPATTRDLPVRIATQIQAVHWASDGRGWFLAAHTAVGIDLYFVDLAGSATLLRHVTGHSWAVPSPDGKRIAFLDQYVDSNLWKLATP